MTTPFAIEFSEPPAGPPGVVEVRVGGFLDAHTVDNFEQAVTSLMKQHYNKVILDLGDLTYISSAGIGSLMVLLQQLRRQQGDLVLFQPTPKVYKILDLLGFTHIFHITDDHGAALEALG